MLKNQELVFINFLCDKECKVNNTKTIIKEDTIYLYYYNCIISYKGLGENVIYYYVYCKKLHTKEKIKKSDNIQYKFISMSTSKFLSKFYDFIEAVKEEDNLYYFNNFNIIKDWFLIPQN